jgi:protein gp37
MSYHRRRIFSLSLGDWLDPEVPIEWLAEMLDTIRRCDAVEWILCTKRPELWGERLELARHAIECDANGNTPAWITAWLGGWTPHNITILASVENQAAADIRIPQLLRIPAARRGLSLEPLLGPVDVFSQGDPHAIQTPRGEILKGGLDWIIIGGESGPRARPCNVEWIRSLVQQGKAACVSMFVKQLGSFCIEENGSQRRRILHDDPKGADPAEWTEDLQVREFPT